LIKINLLFVLIFFTFVTLKSYAQENTETITVIGDSLVGRVSGGEMLKEVFGNVVLKQGNVIITCDHAIQYVSKNDAELIGNVIAVQDSLIIKTPHAYYYGNEKKSESNSGVELNDKKIILDADFGTYYFDEHRAVFQNNVRMYDTVSTLTSNKLIYYKDLDKMIAEGNVKIIDSTDIIQADKVTHFRNDRISIADNNVKITSTKNNSVIFGDHLEDYAKKYYTVVDKNPLFMQIDTTFTTRLDTLPDKTIDSVKTAKLDTLLISCLKMEAFRDTSDLFKAQDSVKIVRVEFASKNDLTLYYRKKREIITKKINEDSQQPILWYDNSQLTGDSVTIYLTRNRIKSLDVNNNAFILSQNSTYPSRIDQTSGQQIKLNFDQEKVKNTEIYGGVHSIYYLYEGKTPNGLNKASSQTANIIFNNNEVTEVRLYGSPTSEYYPENMVEGKETTFTLPGFYMYKNRPTKIDLIRIIRNRD
jgi:lipopolysaccharide export system protein LptA